MEKFLGNVTFGEYCKALYGQYGNRIRNIVYDSTDIFMKLAKKPTYEFKQTNKITKGKFYFIQYNYNGTPIWCPIFVIDDRYSTESQKRIIYAINLEYMKYDYKIMFFDIIYRLSSEIIKKNKIMNDDKTLSTLEIPFNVNFETIYKLLKKNGGYDYVITAFDYMKINGMSKGQPRIFCVSCLLVPRFLFVDTKLVNVKVIHELQQKTKDVEQRQKLLLIIEQFNDLVKDYENDIEDYYKRLKLMEAKYKKVFE